MPYYMAGDYYRAGDGNYAAGSIGSFFKGVVRGVGKAVGAVGKVGLAVAKTAIAATPVGVGINALIPGQSTMQGRPLEPVPGVTGAMQRLVPGGETGFRPAGIGKHRRMNAGNARAARRAIRRIKSVRTLLQSIERELPRRPAPRTGGSRGVITRAEAARALRS